MLVRPYDAGAPLHQLGSFVADLAFFPPHCPFHYTARFSYIGGMLDNFFIKATYTHKCTNVVKMQSDINKK